MNIRDDLAGPRPDLAGRSGQNQPLDLASSPLPIGRRRRGELDEPETHTTHTYMAGEVKAARHDELRARLAAVAELADRLDAGTRLQLSLALADALERLEEPER